MIVFRQKTYSEYDAMRSLYVDLRREEAQWLKVDVINESALPAILRGNNVVIERFVISPRILGKDKYRMYLRIGAKAKLPDEVRLPSHEIEKRLGELRLNFSGGYGGGGNNGDGGKKIKGGGTNFMQTNLTPYVDFSVRVKEYLGDAIKYDKKDRSLVLEFGSIRDAIKALNILPFGINYKLYLLDS